MSYEYRSRTHEREFHAKKNNPIFGPKGPSFFRYKVLFTKQAIRDFKKLSPKLQEKVKSLCMEVLAQTPQEGKRLMRELEGSYSLRISYQDRLVYSISEKEKKVFVERCRTHYGD